MSFHLSDLPMNSMYILHKGFVEDELTGIRVLEV
jgi:hypothetical protein